MGMGPWNRMLEQNIETECWNRMLDQNVGAECWNRMLELNVETDCWNRMLEQNVNLKYWSIYSISKFHSNIPLHSNIPNHFNVPFHWKSPTNSIFVLFEMLSISTFHSSILLENLITTFCTKLLYQHYLPTFHHFFQFLFINSIIWFQYSNPTFNSSIQLEHSNISFHFNHQHSIPKFDSIPFQHYIQIFCSNNPFQYSVQIFHSI